MQFAVQQLMFAGPAVCIAEILGSKKRSLLDSLVPSSNPYSTTMCCSYVQACGRKQ